MLVEIDRHPLAKADEVTVTSLPVIPALVDSVTTELAGVTAELQKILATEDAPTPTPPVEPPVDEPVEPPVDDQADPLTAPSAPTEQAGDDPRSEVEWETLDHVMSLGGNLVALGQVLASADGLPIGQLTGHVSTPVMLIEVTEGSHLERRAEVDRIAGLLGVPADVDYLDATLHAVYFVQRRLGQVLYRAETVVTPPTLAGEDRDEVLVDVALAVPGARPPAAVEVAVPAAGVPAPQLVGAEL